MVTWGIVAVLFTFVQSYTQLVGLRFLLGVAEAGFFPGAILFLSLWVPSRYRSRVLGLFYLAQPLTTVIGAPFAGWLISHDGTFFGLEGWRFMFLGVGLPAIIVGVDRLVLPGRQPGEGQVADSGREGVADQRAEPRAMTPRPTTAPSTPASCRRSRTAGSGCWA